VAETFKDFPEPALDLVEKLLSIDPADRGSAASALKSQVIEIFVRWIQIIFHLVMINGS